MLYYVLCVTVFGIIWFLFVFDAYNNSGTIECYDIAHNIYAYEWQIALQFDYTEDSPYGMYGKWTQRASYGEGERRKKVKKNKTDDKRERIE